MGRGQVPVRWSRASERPCNQLGPAGPPGGWGPSTRTGTPEASAWRGHRRPPAQPPEASQASSVGPGPQGSGRGPREQRGTGQRQEACVRPPEGPSGGSPLNFPFSLPPPVGGRSGGISLFSGPGERKGKKPPLHQVPEHPPHSGSGPDVWSEPGRHRRDPPAGSPVTHEAGCADALTPRASPQRPSSLWNPPPWDTPPQEASAPLPRVQEPRTGPPLTAKQAQSQSHRNYRTFPPLSIRPAIPKSYISNSNYFPNAPHYMLVGGGRGSQFLTLGRGLDRRR